MPKFFRWSSAEFRNQLHFPRMLICTLVRIREVLTFHNVDLRPALFNHVSPLLSLSSLPPFLSFSPEVELELISMRIERGLRISTSGIPNEITIIKRRSRCSRRQGYRHSHSGSRWEVKWIIAPNVENHLSISHSSIPQFFIVSLLRLLLPFSLPGSSVRRKSRARLQR